MIEGRQVTECCSPVQSYAKKRIMQTTWKMEMRGGGTLTWIKTRRHSSKAGVRFVVLFKYIICLTEVFWYQILSWDSYCHNFHFSSFWCITNKKLQKYTHYLRKVGLLLRPPVIPEDRQIFIQGSSAIIRQNNLICVYTRQTVHVHARSLLNACWAWRP